MLKPLHCCAALDGFIRRVGVVVVVFTDSCVTYPVTPNHGFHSHHDLLLERRYLRRERLAVAHQPRGLAAVVDVRGPSSYHPARTSDPASLAVEVARFVRQTAAHAG